ncbi:hypothetical protein J4G08_04975 [Candidatus Poribacteria bacterium]|nr:hypothetical protein [Candidatus Poribacteria bacterium]
MKDNTLLKVFSSGIVASVILILVIVSPISAQERLTPMAEQDFFTSGFYGGGLTFINGDSYVRIQLQPEIPLGKIGIGFDLVLLYNPYAENAEDQFLAEDAEAWDSASTWLRLIRYISFGDPYDPFYFRLGEFDYLTIGHGSIMSGYSNHDRRGLHMNLRKSDNRYGVETMVNDLGYPTIYGGRGFFRPFQRPENNNLLTRFELGTTYLIDIDPNSSEEGEEPLDAVGFDVGFPIIERSSFRFDLYDDFVMINPPPKPENFVLESIAAKEKSKSHSENSVNELGWGNAVGIGFAHTKAIFKFEYRIFSDGYIPAVFDYTYEVGMPEFWGYETNNALRRGFFTQLIWQPMPQLHFLGAYENYDNNTSKIYLGVKESGLVPRLTYRAFYTKRNIGQDSETNFFLDLFDLDEKSALTLEIRYAIFPPMQTIFTHEYRFRRVQTDEGTSQFEPIHKTSIMVGVTTDF